MRKTIIALAALLLAPLGLAAQTAVTYTTLSAAVTGPQASPTQTAVTLASVTGVTAPVNGAVQTILDVDGEAMGVLTVNTATLVATVLRGYQSSTVMGHQSGAVVIVAPPAAYQQSDPVGSCAATGTVASSYTPWINLRTGRQFVCDTATTNKWMPVLSTGSVTPAATAAAIATVGQAFTLNGVVPGEPLAVLQQPAPASLCPLVASRATAANTVTLYFTVLTAAACTPAAGTYMFFDPLLTANQGVGTAR